MPQLVPRPTRDNPDRTGVRIHIGHGKRKWLGTHKDAETAWQVGVDAEQARGDYSETWAEFADRWTRDFNHVKRDGSVRWSPEHRRNLSYALQPFVAKWGRISLSNFPNAEALPWIGSQPEYVLRAVRSMFNDARRNGLVATNPFERLGLEKSRGRKDIVALTEEEVHLLAECALGACEGYGPTMHAFVLWQAYVGCRPLSTFNVRPEDFNVSQGTVYLRGPGLKKHTPRTVIVPEVAARAVARLPQRIDQHWLLVSPRGHKLTSTSLQHHWNKFKSKFEDKLDPRRAQQLRDSRPDGGPIVPYELRHFCATMLWERGVDTKDIAWQLANSREKIEELYGHPTEEHRQSRIRQAFSGTQTGTQEIREVRNRA